MEVARSKDRQINIKTEHHHKTKNKNILHGPVTQSMSGNIVVNW